MKRTLQVAAIMALVAGGGWVAAQTVPAPKPGTAAPAPRGNMMAGDGSTNCPMGGGMMGGGMMGGGMMGGGMMPMMMGGSGTKVDVKKLDKGVSITLTSSDAATVARIQKMAEAMRLMHEAMAQ